MTGADDTTAPAAGSPSTAAPSATAPATSDSADPSTAATAPRRAPGRPRLAPKKREGLSTREEILEVAANLFTQHGYTNTTTRQIAEVVGIKQASLYYHFTDKSSILNALLSGTVEPSVRFAEWLESQPVDSAAKLYTLARFDLDVILQDRWNLHVLYRLPDVKKERGRAMQAALQQHYRQFAERAAADGSDTSAVEQDLDLVFGLVESILLQRDWGEGAARHAYAQSIARGCLRLVRIPENRLPDIEETARQLIADYAG
jgi:AcrR family transcriptional regulator